MVGSVHGRIEGMRSFTYRVIAFNLKGELGGERVGERIRWRQRHERPSVIMIHNSHKVVALLFHRIYYERDVH